MPEYLVAFPDHFLPVQAFEPGRSRYRVLAAALTDILQFAQPGKCANPQAHVSDIYAAYAGADTPSNTTALSATNALDYLAQQGINAIDMAGYIGQLESESGQLGLKHEIQAQNMNGLPQLLVLAGDSQLKHAVSGAPLHNWNIPGSSQPAALIRAGFSTDVANAFYFDPALSAAFAQPVPIAWSDIASSGIEACIAVLPPGVPLPPADFHFAAGVNADGGTIANQWPPVKPQLDIAGMTAQLQTLLGAADSLSNVSAQLKGGAQQMLQQLGKG